MIYELSSAHGGSTTFETKSIYCRVAQQGLPCYTAVARLGFKRRATAVLKSNLIRSIEFGTAVARHLNVSGLIKQNEIKEIKSKKIFKLLSFELVRIQALHITFC